MKYFLSVLAMWALVGLGAQAEAAPSLLAGELIVECTITAEHRASDCVITKAPGKIEAKDAALILETIERKWNGASMTPQPVIGQRRQFMICDGSRKAQKLIGKGVLCGIDLTKPEFAAQDTSGDSARIRAELKKRYTPEKSSVDVEFIRFPTAQEMAWTYPKAADDQAISGGAIISCHWTDEGKVDECRVLAEYPDDMGFGQASADLFVRYARVRPTPDIPSEERWKVMTYLWTIK